MRTWALIPFIVSGTHFAIAETKPATPVVVAVPAESALSLKEKLKALTAKSTKVHSDNLIFDLPVTYNAKVSKWIAYFQGRGNK